MPAFNVVRFRVKPGFEKQFVDFHQQARLGAAGFLGGWLLKTGDRAYCLVAQWRTYQSIVKARPEMIGMLDQTRHMLEDLGNGLGVTDPVSGEPAATLKAARPKRRPARPAKKAARKATKKRRAGK
jgi:hypothetical protein